MLGNVSVGTNAMLIAQDSTLTVEGDLLSPSTGALVLVNSTILVQVRGWLGGRHAALLVGNNRVHFS